MTPITSELSATNGDVQAAIEAGTALAEPAQLEPGNYYAVTVPAGGRVEQIDLDLDKYRAAPRRKTGTTTVSDAASFVHYWNKHSDADSEVYAVADRNTVLAILDAHTSGKPRWGEHRLTLQLKNSTAWLDWTASNGRYLSQVDFAEFIEDHLADIREPAGADLLELAQTFQATTKVTFQSGTRLSSGQRQLTYVEETDAKAGTKGQITIPETFTLGLQVFEDSDVVDQVNARLRYRIQHGELVLAYKLDRPADVARKAFMDTVGSLEGHVSRAILYGTPAGR